MDMSEKSACSKSMESAKIGANASQSPSASTHSSSSSTPSPSASSSSSSLPSLATIDQQSSTAAASTISGLKPLSCRLIRHLLGDTSLSLCPNKTMLPASGNNHNSSSPFQTSQPLATSMDGNSKLMSDISHSDSPSSLDREAGNSSAPNTGIPAGPGTNNANAQSLGTIASLLVSTSLPSSSSSTDFATPSPLSGQSSTNMNTNNATNLTSSASAVTTPQVSQNSNCLIKSLISSASSYFPYPSGSCGRQTIFRKFCKNADGCKKPVRDCGAKFGTPSASFLGQSSAESTIESETKNKSPEEAGTSCSQAKEPTTNTFIKQIICDTVEDENLTTGCQQLRTRPPTLSHCGAAIPASCSKTYGENFVAIIDSVIANIFQTERINSQSLQKAAKAAEIQRLNQTGKCPGSGECQTGEPKPCLTRAKPSEASSLDSGIIMMDCTSPTAESVANMTNIAVHELIAGRRECHLNKSTIEPEQKCQPEECDRANISTAVYQQLIEFELTNDSILKKFQVEDEPLIEQPSYSSVRFDLNRIEKEKLEGLEKAFFPLQLCFSSITDEDMWKRLKRSFWSLNSNINLEYQRQSLLAATESAINMLIVMTKQLPSFMTLPCECQRAQLQSSVMEIMMIRSLLVSPQRLKNQSVLKACAKRHRENSIGDEDHGKASTSSDAGKSHESAGSCTQKYYKFIHQPAKFMHTFNECKAKLLDSLTKPELEPCNHNPLMKYLYENEHLDEQAVEEYLLADAANSECSRDGSVDMEADNANDPRMEAANELGKQYRRSFLKLAKSIDREWHEDKHIFHLLLVILLFRPVNTLKCDVKKKIREEHLTYVYLLKRYLESKFRSYCTARSHFIRLFDRLEEIQKMNDHIVQKLLDYDLICAQNLLENLCVC